MSKFSFKQNIVLVVSMTKEDLVAEASSSLTIEKYQESPSRFRSL